MDACATYDIRKKSNIDVVGLNGPYTVHMYVCSITYMYVQSYINICNIPSRLPISLIECQIDFS